MPLDSLKVELTDLAFDRLRGLAVCNDDDVVVGDGRPTSTELVVSDALRPLDLWHDRFKGVQFMNDTPV